MTISSLNTLFIGVVATFTMDFLSAVGIKLRLTAPLSPNLIGRWFASVAQAKPIHEDIARVSAVPHEIAIAAPVHYLIGIVLAITYVWGTSHLALPAKNLGLAMAFAMFTNILPWLLMFPAMGYGFFGSRGPTGTRLFVSSLFSHACYGMGIWIGIRIFGV